MAEFDLGSAVLGTEIDLTGLHEGIAQAKDDSDSGFSAIGKGIGAALQIGIAAAGVAIAGLGVAAVDTAAQVNQATRDIQARLGATADEAERLGQVALEIWATGWVDSIDTAAASVVQLRQQLGPLSDELLIQLGGGIAAVSDTFEAEGPVLTNAIKAIRDNFPGTSEATALDLITAAFQRGLNSSGDLLESITEYGPQFGSGGASAAQFFSVLETGLSTGVMGVDKAGDMFKEFAVRIQDGSTLTRDSLQMLGLDADAILSGLARGTLEPIDAFEMVQGALRNTGNEALQMQAGVGLLGTQFEDLGLDAALAVTTMSDSFIDVAGATDSLAVRYESLGAAGTAMWRQLLVTIEPVGSALLDIVNSAMPSVMRGFEVVRGVIEDLVELFPNLLNLGAQAFSWGANIGQQFADGIASAAQYVVGMVQQLGSLIAFWLRPGSPPRILPDIDQWGAETAQVWADGFGEADLSAIQNLGNQIQGVLKGLVATGQFDEAGIIPAVLGSERAIAAAIRDADRFGQVSEEALRSIIDTAGPAGPKVEGLVRSFFDLRRATQDVERAQADLNRITAEYAAQIDPLSAELDAINDQRQAIDDQIRVRDLQEDIASGKLDELEQQRALLQIQEIQKRAELRGIEDNRDAAVSAAEERLRATEEAQRVAQDRLKDEQAATQSLNHQNELIGQQMALLERLAQQAEAAASAKGGGGGFNAADIDVPVPTMPPEIEAISETLGGITEAATDAQNSVVAFFDSLMAGTQNVLAPAIALFEPLVAIFEDAPTPVEGLLNVLSEISPTFELMRGMVEAALPPIQSIIETVFGIITGVIVNQGAGMLASFQATWNQITIFVHTLLPPIQSIIETVFGTIAAFLAENGSSIEAFIGNTWNAVAGIIQTSVAIVNAIIVPAFQTIATFLQTHSDDIQHILTSAWNTISGVVTGALNLLQGLLNTVMAAIQGDWSGAWESLQATSARFVLDVLGVVESFLDTIAGFFGTSLDELAALWEGNWNKLKELTGTVIGGLIELVLGLPSKVKGVGEAVVAMIWDGIKAEWGKLVKWFDGQLQALRDKLPFSEPKDSSSPLYGLAKSGASIVAQILIGLTARAGDIPAAMADMGKQGILGLLQEMEAGLPGFLGEIDRIAEEMRNQLRLNANIWTDEEKRNWQERIDSIVKIAETLPERIADATAGLYDIQANMARQAERNLAQLGNFDSGIRDSVKLALREAELAAGEIDDPAEAAAFFQLRSKQIIEIARLEQEWADKNANRMKAVHDEHRKALDDLDKRQNAVDKEFTTIDARTNKTLGDLFARLANAKTDLERLDIQRKIDETHALAELEYQRLYDEQDAINQAREAEAVRYQFAIDAANEEAAITGQHYKERIELTKQAHEAELAALKTRQEAELSMFEDLANSLQQILGNVPAHLLNALRPLEDLLLRLTQSANTGVLYIPQPNGIGNNAEGTDFWRGGLSWVGERGPELLNLPRGAQILPFDDAVLRMATPLLGAMSASAAGRGALDVAIELSFNDRGQSWLERLIDTRIDAKTNQAAGGADVRRRTR